MKNINGYLYLIAFFVLDALFPIFSYFALQTIPTLWLILFSVGIAILFGLIVFFKDKLYKQYNQKNIRIPTFLSCLFLGIGGLLYFFGIEYSSPSIAAILLLLQTFFAFIIFNVFGREPYNFKQIIGAILMFVGGVLILYDGENIINFGAIIMCVACVAFTLGNYYTKQASLKGANPFFLLINRNFLMFIITFILALIFIGPIEFQLLKQNIVWIFLIGFLVLFLGKILWIQALSKLNSFVAISSFPMIPLLVMVFSFLLLDDVPTSREILGFVPILIGSILLVQKN